jgi:chromosome segregation ATPase
VATIEDLENKVREVAAKVEGEKQVTRRLYEQALRNSDQIGTLRLKVGTVITQNEKVVSEIVQTTSALRSPGARLETLTRDVVLLRNELTELRRGQEEIHVRVDRLDERVEALRIEVQGLRAGQEDLRAGQEALRTDVEALRDGQLALHAEVNRKLDWIIAAVSPRDGHSPDA